jgi:hypothetical protein
MSCKFSISKNSPHRIRTLVPVYYIYKVYRDFNKERLDEDCLPFHQHTANSPQLLSSQKNSTTLSNRSTPTLLQFSCRVHHLVQKLTQHLGKPYYPTYKVV